MATAFRARSGEAAQVPALTLAAPERALVVGRPEITRPD
jgi:hypothetical protein